MNTKQAQELVNLSYTLNKPLMVGFKMRFEPVFIRAKELIPKLGKLHAVSTTKIQPYHKRTKEDWRPKVGAMYELSVHEFDLINWIANLSPESIYAELKYDHNWEREDKFFLIVKYDKGVVGELMGMYTDSCQFHYRDLTITFLGENGYMRVERPDRIELHLDDFSIERVDPQRINPFEAELSNFVNVVTRGARPLIPAEAGLCATQMVETAICSYRRKREVKIEKI